MADFQLMNVKKIDNFSENVKNNQQSSLNVIEVSFV